MYVLTGLFFVFLFFYYYYYFISCFCLCATVLFSAFCYHQHPWFLSTDEWSPAADTCTNCSVEEADLVEAPATDSSPVFPCLSSPLEHLPEASESCFIQFESCPMEESWFITPPPCFTAGGLTTIKVETSPMENLLIEHPSMSVYAVHNTCHSLNETGCGDEEFHSPGSPRYV